MITNLWDSISNTVYSLCNALLNILPDSPFDMLGQIPEVAKILRWINWVIPIQFFLSSMAAWLGAISIYYAYSVIMKWIKLVS